jgi:hypothetical protein
VRAAVRKSRDEVNKANRGNEGLWRSGFIEGITARPSAGTKHEILNLEADIVQAPCADWLGADREKGAAGRIARYLEVVGAHVTT